MTLDLLGNPRFCIPAENIKKIVIQESVNIPYYIINKASDFVLPIQTHSYLCAFSAEGQATQIYDVGHKLYEEYIIRSIYNSHTPDTLNLESISLFKFGCDLTLFYDKDALAAENPFASAFD